MRKILISLLSVLLAFCLFVGCKNSSNIEPELTGIEVTIKPRNTQYKDSVLDKTGMFVSGVYKIGNTEMRSFVSDYTTNFDTASFDSTGEKTVTVTFGNYTTTFKVVVEEKTSKVPSKIELEGTPASLTFNDFDNTAFNTKDMNVKIKVTYSDNSTEVVDYEISESNPKSFILYSPTISDGSIVKNTNTPNDKNQTEDTVSHNFTVYYTGGGVTLTCSFKYDITVYDKYDYMMKGGLVDPDGSLSQEEPSLSGDEDLEWFDVFELEWIPGDGNDTVKEIEFVKQTPQSFEEEHTSFKDQGINLIDTTIGTENLVKGYKEVIDVIGEESDETYIYKIYIVGEYFLGNPNCSLMFSYFTSLTNITNINLLDTSVVTNMCSMFNGCENLKVLSISGWNTQNVTDMSYLFSSCEVLTSLIISDWDTSKVTDMNNMFSECHGLKTLDLSEWDTSSVINMKSIFENSHNLIYINLSGWDTSKVSDMSRMFYECGKLKTLCIPLWDTSSVKNMNSMFAQCTVLSSLSDVSSWNTENVTDMGSLFYECRGLTSLDLSSWNTSKVTKMSCMFAQTNLSTITVGSSWSMNDIADNYESTGEKYFQMFNECTSLNSFKCPNSFNCFKEMIDSQTLKTWEYKTNGYYVKQN